MRHRAEDGHGAVVAQLLLRPATRDDADRLETGLRRRFDVPPRVADHDRVAGARLLQRRLDRVGMWLAQLDVVLGRPRLDSIARATPVDEDLEAVLAPP